MKCILVSTAFIISQSVHTPCIPYIFKPFPKIQFTAILYGPHFVCAAYRPDPVQSQASIAMSVTDRALP